jgi:hypothetical protein
LAAAAAIWCGRTRFGGDATAASLVLLLCRSFWEIMLQPLLQAANDTFCSSSSSSKTLHFAMGGEMGGTLLNHPAQYLVIFKTIRTAWKSNARLRLGVTFYHAYTPGQVIHKPDLKGVKPQPDSPLGALDGGYGPLLPFDQWPGAARVRNNTQGVEMTHRVCEYAL